MPETRPVATWSTSPARSEATRSEAERFEPRALGPEGFGPRAFEPGRFEPEAFTPAALELRGIGLGRVSLARVTVGKLCRSLAIAGLATLAGCLGGGGQPSCKIEVVKLEKWQLRPGALDAAYRVRGQAGAPAVVALSAKLGPGNYITGPGVEIAPGPFVAIVDLKLTGAPPELVAVLDVGGRRCLAKAKKPQ